MANSMGGGQKINILKRELEKYNTDPELVVLFTDGYDSLVKQLQLVSNGTILRYDVILTEEPEDVLNKFRSMKARVVFGAETFCWPDQSLIVLFCLFFLCDNVKYNCSFRMLIRKWRRIRRDFSTLEVSLAILMRYLSYWAVVQSRTTKTISFTTPSSF